MKWRIRLVVIMSLIFLVACSSDEASKSENGKAKKEDVVEQNKLEQHPLRLLGDDQLQQTMEMLSFFNSNTDRNLVPDSHFLNSVDEEQPYEFYERFEDGDGAYVVSGIEKFIFPNDLTYKKITNDEMKEMNNTYAERFSEQAKKLQKIVKESDPEQKIKYFQTVIEKYKQLAKGYKELNDVVGTKKFSEQYEQVMLLYADIDLLKALQDKAVETSSDAENFFDEYNDLISTDKYETLTEADKKFLAGGLMASMILLESEMESWGLLYTLFDISKTHAQDLSEYKFFKKTDEYRKYLAEQESYAPFAPFVGYMGTSFSSLGVTEIEEPEKGFMILEQYVNESPVEFPRLQLLVELVKQELYE